jgi:hypothetical protein
MKLNEPIYGFLKPFFHVHYGQLLGIVSAMLFFLRDCCPEQRDQLCLVNPFCLLSHRDHVSATSYHFFFSVNLLKMVAVLIVTKYSSYVLF